ncbi:hypothetical protein NliqN6_6679 [Naganishia liquefaciens]|uniref:chitinase n=1 Tax=Naganishia liquefaciens TaxID=104408 RepID=A0A8H3U000_9TREE|nr:hypothetical protein NliqN6_6679 [Naganishia liquefaciens]
MPATAETTGTTTTESTRTGQAPTQTGVGVEDTSGSPDVPTTPLESVPPNRRPSSEETASGTLATFAGVATGTTANEATKTSQAPKQTGVDETSGSPEVPKTPLEEPPTHGPGQAPPSAPLELNWEINPEAAKMKHRVTYIDWNVLAGADPDPLPLPGNLKGYNRLLFSFFMVTRPEGKAGAGTMGPIDKAQVWSEMEAAKRKKLKAEYKAAGVSVMVSAFGATDPEVAQKAKAATVAAALAKFVKDYDLDGVDVDFEDQMTAASIAWVIELQTALRTALPSPYLISHAPQAPWFDTTDRWAGGYRTVHEKVGTGIDFYNIQYYNQGASAYTTCESIFGATNAGTTVTELQTVLKLKPEQIVIGKPARPKDANNGYMSPEVFSGCLKRGRAKGWNGGFMFWQWNVQDGPAAAKAIMG